MADDDQIVIEIAPDEADGAVKTGPDRGADGKFVAREPADDLAAQFADLQAKSQRDADALAAERRSRADAEREAARAREEVTTARGEVIESQVSTVESGLAAAQAEADAAEREYTAAFEAGDGAKMGQAQRKIAKAEARIARLDEAKVDLETRKVKPAIEADQRRAETPRRQEATVDPVEAYVSGRSEPTAKWLRAHPDFVTDQRKNAKLTAAHWDATGEGIAPDTPEYFAHVENYIGIKPNGQNGLAASAAKPRRSTVPAAPVNGSGGSGGNGNGTQVVLSRGEALAAEDGTHVWNYDDTSPQKKFRKGDPIGKQEFARRKLALTKQGAYDRSYVES